MHQTIIDAIRNHANEFESEVCGLVLADNTIKRCVNVHQSSIDNFAIAASDFVTDKPIVATYHSHLISDDFSPHDIRSSKQCRIPFVLCHKPTGRMRYYDPNQTLPYIGREWSYSASNCYTLMQDWYREELKIKLPDFYMERDRDWLRKDVGYAHNLPLNGFRQLDKHEPIQKHDVILMTLGLMFPNHVGVIIEAGTNTMLHHLAYSKSETIVYAPGNDLYKSTHSVWRLL